MGAEPKVSAKFQLGPETYSVAAAAAGGALSEQLVSFKEQSMSVLKEFITKNNVPTDVPDEIEPSSDEEDDELLEKPQVKSKKTKIN